MSDPHPTPDPDTQRTRRLIIDETWEALLLRQRQQERARQACEVVIEGELAERLQAALLRGQAVGVCAAGATVEDLVRAALHKGVEEILTPDEK